MEDLNLYIKKIFIIKILGIFIIITLLIGSILVDWILFYEGEELKKAYSDLDNISNTEIHKENQTREISEFYEKYSFIDKEKLKEKLECIEYIDCKQLVFNSENNKIGFYAKDISTLNKYMEVLKENGFQINIVSVRKENKSTYFELEAE